MAFACAAVAADPWDDINIVADGDSLMAFNGATASAAPGRLTDILATNHPGVYGGVIRNYAVEGQRWDQMQADAAAQIDTKLIPGKTNLLLLCAGANNWRLGWTPTQTYASMVDYLRARSAAGWKLVFTTAQAMYFVGRDLGWYTNMNALVKGNSSNITYFAVADVASRPEFQNTADPTYYVLPDPFCAPCSVHHTQPAINLWAEMMDTAISEALSAGRSARTDYEFENTLASSVEPAPQLEFINSGHQFTNTSVDGFNKMALRFPAVGGLELASVNSVIPSNTYTVVMLVSLDSISGWGRLLDTKAGTVDQGLYIYNGRLHIRPDPGESDICITNNTWHQVALTRDDAGLVKVYSDGVLRLTYNDAITEYKTFNGDEVLRLFKDDTTEDHAGMVARVRIYDRALTAQEITVLDRLQSDTFKLASVGAIDGTYSFNVLGPAGGTCVLERSTNLTVWGGFSNIANFPGNMVISVPIGPTEFFRVRIP